jgi:hypothetical protein
MRLNTPHPRHGRSNPPPHQPQLTFAGTTAEAAAGPLPYFANRPNRSRNRW